MILFDLDGTLVDTAHDLAYALNLQRERHGMAVLPLDVIRPYASHGSKGLLSIGFDLTPEDARFDVMREEYLALYDQVLTRKPVLFPGVAELLAALDEENMPWGVVTNKPRRFTQPLLQNIGLLERAACVVSGDDASRPKPHPDTLFLACEQAGINPHRCWYVGDAERDIQAGRAAGMKTVVALYGYLGTDDRPDEWGADVSVNAPLELLRLINGK
ncbi:HAD family hydrolase [Methylotenera sp. G11]|uniref:HAD family hydrolase n=1 Tax=Methylotenera sp. G11 TaxID=1506585 RepID=UPI0006456EC1|nr:HAD-IA family hydrolase [Methylotenera sp. G11]